MKWEKQEEGKLATQALMVYNRGRRIYKTLNSPVFLCGSTACIFICCVCLCIAFSTPSIQWVIFSIEWVTKCLCWFKRQFARSQACLGLSLYSYQDQKVLPELPREVCLSPFPVVFMHNRKMVLLQKALAFEILLIVLFSGTLLPF